MYDLLIIGAGPAGLTASIYASCFHLKHVVVSTTLGGQLEFAPDILNYPGFKNVSGKELTQKMVEQLTSLGGQVISDSVVTLSKTETGFTAKTESGKSYESQAVILATGTERRKLNIPGEAEYTARGVHYCTTCEKFDYDGKVCAIVGGANSALQGAIHLSQAAKEVHIIYRGTELRGDAVWLEQIQKIPKIKPVFQTILTEINGDKEKVTSIQLKNISTNETSELTVNKVFIEIGGVPGSALVAGIGVDRDPGGYIKVNGKLETNIPGIFAAGDLITHQYSIEQISTAVGLGARAAASSFAYLKGEKPPSIWGGSQIKRI